jgi:hypothetical protein
VLELEPVLVVVLVVDPGAVVEPVLVLELVLELVPVVLELVPAVLVPA